MRAGWFPDPTGRYPLRWHDGIQWTPQAMDGWQRPVVDPLPPPAGRQLSSPAGPAQPPYVPRVPAQPAPVPVRPPSVPVRPPSVPVQPQALPIWRYAFIGVAAVLMMLGLVLLPWVEVWDGNDWRGTSYPRVAVAVSRYGGEDLNLWQQLYNQGLAVGMAVSALLGTVATVVLATRGPGPVPDWCLIPLLLVFVFFVASFLGWPSASAGAGVRVGWAPYLVSFAFLLLGIAIPVEQEARRDGRR